MSYGKTWQVKLVLACIYVDGCLSICICM